MNKGSKMNQQRKPSVITDDKRPKPPTTTHKSSVNIPKTNVSKTTTKVNTTASATNTNPMMKGSCIKAASGMSTSTVRKTNQPLSAASGMNTSTVRKTNQPLEVKNVTAKPSVPRTIQQKQPFNYKSMKAKVEEQANHDGMPENKAAFNRSLSYVNRVRVELEKQKPPIDFKTLLNEMKKSDKAGKGVLTLEVVCEMCKQYGVNINWTSLRTHLQYLQIVDKNKEVKYKSLVKMLDYSQSLQTLQYTEQKVKTPASKYNCKGLEIIMLEGPKLWEKLGLRGHDIHQIRSIGFIKDTLKDLNIVIPEKLFKNLWKQAMLEEKAKGASLNTFHDVIVKLHNQ